MEFLELLQKLEQSKEYKEWKTDDVILAHGFTVLDNKYEESEPWQAGYYNKKEDKITTFKITKNVVEKGSSEEVFKKPETKIGELDPSKLKKNFEEIKKIIKSYQEEKYKQEIPNKIIVLLQVVPEVGTVWNVTIITAAFNTVNMKIDVETGEVKEDHITSLLNYNQDTQ